MATITYRTDEETKQLLAIFAEQQNMSINQAIDVIVNNAIQGKGAFYEFQKRASAGDSQKALAVLGSKAAD